MGRAIAAAAAERFGSLPAVESFQNRPGLGVEGVVDGHAVVAGRPPLLADWSLLLPPELDGAVPRPRRSGAPWSWRLGRRRHAVFVVADAVKPTSADAIERLRDLGLSPMLLTGDNEPTAQAVAGELGIEEVVARCCRQTRSTPSTVYSMTVGWWRWSATASTMPPRSPEPTSASPWAPGRTSPSRRATSRSCAATCARLPTLWRCPGARSAIIKGNLFWAFAYNVAALPIAALGLPQPAHRRAAMACSSLFVVGNSLRLRRFQPR